MDGGRPLDYANVPMETAPIGQDKACQLTHLPVSQGEYSALLSVPFQLYAECQWASL